MTVYITHDMLVAAGACAFGCQEFLEHWPSGQVAVSVEAAVQVARVFDWDFAADLLTPEGEAQCRWVMDGPAWAARVDGLAAAREDYRREEGADSSLRYVNRWAEVNRAYREAVARAFAEAALAHGVRAYGPAVAE